MFEIKLFNISKNANSLKVPDISTGRTFQCEMKTNSSIVSPVIDITYNTDNVPVFNYAYIQEFNRYYFIVNTIYDLGIWTLQLTCDVMGTYRSDILSSNQYVIRSASHSNPDLIDNMYPTYRDDECFSQSSYITGNDVKRYSNLSDDWLSVPSNYFSQKMRNGAFMIGVLSDTETGVTYYIMPGTAFTGFMAKCFTLTPSNMSDVSTGLARALYNFMQYITVCRWYPIMPLAGNVDDYTVNSIHVGYYNVDVSDVPDHGFIYALKGDCIEKFRFIVSVPEHPQYQDTGFKYLQKSPYTEVNLYFNPFGNIPIDTTKLTTSRPELRVIWYVDYATGTAALEIRDRASNMLIYTDTAEYGVALPISSLVYDWKASLLMSGVNFLKGPMSIKPAETWYNWLSYLPGSVPNQMETVQNWVGTDMTYQEIIDFGINNIIDVMGSTLGQVSTKGTQGSFLQFKQDNPYLMAWFSKIVEPNNEKLGSPYFTSTPLSRLSGFTSVQNPKINFTNRKPTVNEQATIYAMMSSGFYIE